MTEEQVFLTALDFADRADRTAYLEKACGGDAEFRRQVDALLAAHFKPGKFLDDPIVEQMRADESAPGPDYAVTQRGYRPDEATGAAGGSDEEHADLRFLHPPTRPDALGRIGHYEVLQVVGRGGFGIVFRAFDDVLHRVVALKALLPALAATSPARKRFLREARASAAVRHENVVQVYAVEEQPLPYLVMEFIPGESLQQRLGRIGPLEVPEIVGLGRQIAEGLAAAHATGLIHRDITPGNVLIEAGPSERVKLTDFGLARAADDASLTQSNTLAGTPMYMAPEQAKGEPLDHRADLFSLGSVLYALATGRPPFRAATTFAVLKRVVEDDPRPIREVIPELPQWLADVIAKLHAKKPVDRFQSAREVADVFAAYEALIRANAEPEEFARLRPNDRATRQSGRWKWVAAAALLLPVAALALTELVGVTHWLRTASVRAPSQSVSRPDDAGTLSQNPKPVGNPLTRGAPDHENTLGMKFKLIPAGKFRMGSPKEEIDRCLMEFGEGTAKFQDLRKRHEGEFEKERLPAEGPDHEVEITQPFYMGTTEVTFGQFRRFVEAKGYDVGDDGWKAPGVDNSDDSPVICVSWHNAADFCNWLSETEGKKYRLPTEAEWEYCCRAGKARTRYCFGDDDEQLETYAWYSKLSPLGSRGPNQTHRVGLLKPNAWGLYDMHGNAWEWCRDSYDPDYYKNSPLKDPRGGADATRVVRGGSWYWSPEFCRSAFRHHVAPGLRYYDVGFRVVLVAP